tara:strand:+ start:615 stop:1058 length:444 start_codon:yes stop_codon:yes gene_type:complete
VNKITTITLNFNEHLSDDSSAKYAIYFTDNFDTTSCLPVNDAEGNPVFGLINGRKSISFDFDYYVKNQQSYKAGTPTKLTIITIGLESKWFRLDFDIDISLKNVCKDITPLKEVNYCAYNDTGPSLMTRAMQFLKKQLMRESVDWND